MLSLAESPSPALVLDGLHRRFGTITAVAGVLRAGGAVLAFVDPLSERLVYRPEPAPGARPGLRDLLAGWSATLAEGRFVGDRRHAMIVRARVGGRDGDVDYVGWLGLPGEALAGSHGATADLGRLVLKSAGALTPRSGPRPRAWAAAGRAGPIGSPTTWVCG